MPLLGRVPLMGAHYLVPGSRRQARCRDAAVTGGSHVLPGLGPQGVSQGRGQHFTQGRANLATTARQQEWYDEQGFRAWGRAEPALRHI